jgi:hypothetical protein
MNTNEHKYLRLIQGEGEVACRAGRVLLAIIFLLGLAGCEADFAEDPLRPRPTRAVESPQDRNSAIGEVTAPAQGTVPLVVVEPGRTKDEPATVRTILNSNENAATQPAAKGELETPPVAPAPLKVVEQRNSEDRMWLGADAEGIATITITSPSGIGAVVLERTGEMWPPVVHVRLQYASGKSFSNLESFAAAEVLGQDQRVTLKTTVRKEEGGANVSIPSFVRSERIGLAWTDANR